MIADYKLSIISSWCYHIVFCIGFDAMTALQSDIKSALIYQLMELLSRWNWYVAIKRSILDVLDPELSANRSLGWRYAPRRYVTFVSEILDLGWYICLFIVFLYKFHLISPHNVLNEASFSLISVIHVFSLVFKVTVVMKYFPISNIIWWNINCHSLLF